MAKMDSWKCQTRHKRIGVANEAPKKRGCGLNDDAIKRAPEGTITRRGPTAWTR